MRVVLDHAEELAPNIMTFFFSEEEPVEYLAGQFTQIYLPHDNMDERGDKRWFTLSSSPAENRLCITTKFSRSNSSSFKIALRSLEPGTKLNIADPMGDFVLPKDPAVPLLFVAAGMGITPMRSMVGELAAAQIQRPIHLLHSVRSPEELIWRELFETSGIKYTPIITDKVPGWEGKTGHLEASLLASLANSDTSQTVYLSGPETMIEQLVRDLPKLGVSLNRLMTDYFPGYGTV